MCKIAIVLACMSCAGHGRQVETSSEFRPKQEQLQVFRSVLLALKPTAAFNTRTRQSVVKPILTSLPSAIEHLADGSRALLRLRGDRRLKSARDDVRNEAASRSVGAGTLLGLRGGVSTGKLVSSVSSKLTPMIDESITTIACLGVSRSAPPVVSEALGLPPVMPKVSIVPASTPLAVLDVASASESERAIAAAAADVLVLEVHFEDLVRQTVHGLAQLLPVVKPSVKLPSPRTPPKLLLLTITDYVASEASEADVSAFASMKLEEELGDSAADLQLQCVFVPRKSTAPDGYTASLSTFYGALTSESTSATFSAPASSVVTSIQSAETALLPAKEVKQTKTVSETHTAYQCSAFAEAAAREFQKGATELRKAAATELLVDFGARANELMLQALEQFDAASAAFEGRPEAASARAVLAEQLKRALYGPFRKQLAVLQQLTLANFLSSLVATKATADIEARLNGLVKKAMTEFDASAKLLLPFGMPWSAAYERAAVKESMQEAAREHVEKLQIQGLCISKASARLPVDFSAHWLLPHPFGHDSRYDPISPDDISGYKDDAEPMRLDELEEYRLRAQKIDKKLLRDKSDLPELDPRQMVYETPKKQER